MYIILEWTWTRRMTEICSPKNTFLHLHFILCKNIYEPQMIQKHTERSTKS